MLRATNYVAEANDSNPNTGGFMTDNSEGNITSAQFSWWFLPQIAYGNRSWDAKGRLPLCGQCGVHALN